MLLIEHYFNIYCNNEFLGVSKGYTFEGACAKLLKKYPFDKLAYNLELNTYKGKPLTRKLI
mgnify:CR=1 FL=1